MDGILETDAPGPDQELREEYGPIRAAKNDGGAGKALAPGGAPWGWRSRSTDGVELRNAQYTRVPVSVLLNIKMPS